MKMEVKIGIIYDKKILKWSINRISASVQKPCIAFLPFFGSRN